jgi:hypothetical protein
LRLRTACDLDLMTLETRPKGFAVPELSDLEADLPGFINDVAVKGQFAIPSITTVTWKPKTKKKKDSARSDNNAPDGDGASDE